MKDEAQASFHPSAFTPSFIVRFSGSDQKVMLLHPCRVSGEQTAALHFDHYLFSLLHFV
ncbi:hypothetical protein BH18ACI2_BH18ACI2_19020 [soil metagenome]|nr:hypothetical protein [Acidobacteriota bacterium]